MNLEHARAQAFWPGREGLDRQGQLLFGNAYCDDTPHVFNTGQILVLFFFAAPLQRSTIHFILIV